MEITVVYFGSFPFLFWSFAAGSAAAAAVLSVGLLSTVDLSARRYPEIETTSGISNATFVDRSRRSISQIRFASAINAFHCGGLSSSDRERLLYETRPYV